jgi:hypothetical protein
MSSQQIYRITKIRGYSSKYKGFILFNQLSLADYNFYNYQKYKLAKKNTPSPPIPYNQPNGLKEDTAPYYPNPFLL